MMSNWISQMDLENKMHIAKHLQIALLNTLRKNIELLLMHQKSND